MRIAIDMQGAQGSGRDRGIGRYTLALADGLVRMNKRHEILLVLNGLFPESVASISAYFRGRLPQENILTWTSPGPLDFISGSKNAWRRQAAELVREAFIATLNPDVVLVSNMIEGLVDNCVTSIGIFSENTDVAVIVYDLIPLLNKEAYFTSPQYGRWYLEKLKHLKGGDLFLSISEASRIEAIEHAEISEERIFNISTATDPKFYESESAPESTGKLLDHLGIVKPFVFYCGGSDPRKNLDRLISAYAKLPTSLRETHQLLLVGTIPPQDINALLNHAAACGLMPSEIAIPGYLEDDFVIALYHACRCFVLPSWHEGFGLPALEAMACGAPVIGSNKSSIPEVIGNPDALFDPFDEQSISNKIEKVLSDENFRASLIRRGLAQSRQFSWDLTAQRTFAILESSVERKSKPPVDLESILARLIRSIAELPGSPSQADLVELAEAIDATFPVQAHHT
jgi:glycosyltransferase involved in cell wall biosynthesis